LFHPAVIVLGGGLSRIGEPFRRAVAQALPLLVMKVFRFLRDFRVIFRWSQWAETLERVANKRHGIATAGRRELGLAARRPARFSLRLVAA
jgi:hypothetical protein